MNHVGLNEDQHEAVHTLDGPLLVLAGAGSGKTRVVTYRIAQLLAHGVPASQILGLTFTNKAAGEMQERIRKLAHSNVLVCTFHSLGARILRESIHELGYRNDFTIYDEDDVIKLLRACLEELKIRDKRMEPKAFRSLISRSKNQLLGPSDVASSSSDDPAEKALPLVYERYQAHLKEYNALDFDDLLFLIVRLFRERPDVLRGYQDRWSHLLIDEYQDTNQAQYEIVCKLVEKSQNLCVVGDPDQSIYSWRGANIQNILNFEKDFRGAKVIRLEQNYRSRSNILEAANHLIGFNHQRFEKNLWSALGPGEKIRHFTADSEQSESRFVADTIRYYHEEKGIPYQDMVIFYRTNFQSRAFEDRLLSARVPYVIVGGISFYQRREIKDILAFMRMVHSELDFISFSRTINLPRRGIGNASIEKIRMGASRMGMTILDYCRGLVEGSITERLTAKQKKALEEYLSVIHKLKRIYQECSLKELVVACVEETGYLNHLYEDPDTFEDRKGNLDELIAKAMEWEQERDESALSEFLEELSLKSSLDEADTDLDRVNLMTIHNGKGLEYTLVFLVGMEEDLFPHANSRASEEAVEEERRLCYVGMTRAKEYLYLTHARFRFLWGTARTQRASRFFKEVPAQYLQKVREGMTFGAAAVEEVPEPAAAFDPGDAVFHQDFGVGVIQQVYDSAVGLTYKVMFSKDSQSKDIVARYAHLTKL
jgi:DNA helicase II / ATP-dependent DNA helicase PcrA